MSPRLASWRARGARMGFRPDTRPARGRGALLGLRAFGALGVLGVIVSALAVPAGLASAAASATEGQRPWSIGLLAGSVQAGGNLADYQWSRSPRAAWGVQALAGARRITGGVRLWNTHALQGMGEAAEPVSVRGTSFELLGRGRLLRAGGIDVHAIASGGWLHLGYHPDRVEFQMGASDPVVVRLAPIGEWIAGGGFALERRFAGAWRVGIEVERRVFGLDTAHRNGETIVERREAAGDWNARIALARWTASR